MWNEEKRVNKLAEIFSTLSDSYLFISSTALNFSSLLCCWRLWLFLFFIWHEAWVTVWAVWAAFSPHPVHCFKSSISRLPSSNEFIRAVSCKQYLYRYKMTLEQCRYILISSSCERNEAKWRLIYHGISKARLYNVASNANALWSKCRHSYLNENYCHVTQENSCGEVECDGNGADIYDYNWILCRKIKLCLNRSNVRIFFRLFRAYMRWTARRQGHAHECDSYFIFFSVIHLLWSVYSKWLICCRIVGAEKCTNPNAVAHSIPSSSAWRGVVLRNKCEKPHSNREELNKYQNEKSTSLHQFFFPPLASYCSPRLSNCLAHSL